MTKNYIAGEWLPAAEVTPNINPSNTNDVVGEYARASATETERAIAAAFDAFPAWSRSSIQTRHDILKAVGMRSKLARTSSAACSPARRERPCRKASARSRALDKSSIFAGECLRMAGEKLPSVRPFVDVEITREPVGVIGLITPWNFPIAIPAWKIAPALAYGNTVVFKPAELVPGSAHALSEIIVRAGVPPGVFNLVMGRGSVVGEAMLNSSKVSAISFTGSVPTGRKIAQTCITSEPMKKLQLEMGGKNPMVVLDDADLELAVECAVNSAFFSTGQRCTASSRLIVTDGIHDRFVTALQERMQGLVIDDALKAGTHVGPVVDQSQLDQDMKYISIGQVEGAKLVAGESC